MKKGYFTIKDAMLNGLIPESYHDLFSKYEICDEPYCKSPIIINANRTDMRCSNPNCPKVLTGRVLKTFNRFGIMNFGAKNAYEYIVSNGIKSVAEAVLKPPNSIFKDVVEWFKRPHSTDEVIEILSMPGIDKKATKFIGNLQQVSVFTYVIEVAGIRELFKNEGCTKELEQDWYSNVLDLIKEDLAPEYIHNLFKSVIDKDEFSYSTATEVYDESVRLGLELLAMKTMGGSGLESHNCASIVYTYYDEIITLSELIKEPVEVTTVNPIIITGDIVNVAKPNGMPYERQEFIDYANTISQNYGVRYTNSTAFNSSEFVIADTPSSTNKYKRGVAMGKLITSDRFIELLKQRERDYIE